MTANSNHAASTASNLNNPFLNQDERTFVSAVPAAQGTGVGGLSDPLLQEEFQKTANSLRSVDSTHSTSATSSSSTAPLSANLSNVTGQHSQHAGSLAPREETIAPAHVPEGTEHVSNLLTGIAGAVLSAPAAALEAVSPTAAAKTSDGVAFITSKLPAVSLEGVANTTRGVAASAYNSVPEGTAATVQSYAGAAVAKAQEVLPPALGGSARQGNTGEGELAKSPTQLASEYGSATSQAISNAAASAASYVQQTLGLAKQTAVDTANTASQKASEATNIASQKASEVSNVASQKANEASNAASQTASDLSNRASSTASQAAQATRETVNNASQQASNTASQAAQATRENADYASRSASQKADEYTSNRTSSTTTGSQYPSSGISQTGSSDYLGDEYLKHAGIVGSNSTTSGAVYSNQPVSTSEQIYRRENALSGTSNVDVGATTATQSHTGQAGTYEYTEGQLNQPRTTL